MSRALHPSSLHPYLGLLTQLRATFGWLEGRKWDQDIQRWG